MTRRYRRGRYRPLADRRRGDNAAVVRAGLDARAASLRAWRWLAYWTRRIVLASAQCRSSW